MVNFMLDPKGEMPWNEDPLADDVLHLQTPKVKSSRTKSCVSRDDLGFSKSIETTFAIIGDVLCTMVWLLQEIETSLC